MTKQDLENKLTEKKTELATLEKEHRKTAEDWQKAANQNVQRANELAGGIAVLEELLQGFEGESPA